MSRLRVLLLSCLLLLLYLPFAFGATKVAVCAMYTPGLLDHSTALSTYISGAAVALGESPSPLVSFSGKAVAGSSGSGFIIYSQFSTQQSYMAMMGPAGQPLVESVFVSITTHNLLCFSPFSQIQTQSGAVVPTYREQLYWTLPSSQAQSVALLFFFSQRELFPKKQLGVRTNRVVAADSALKMLQQAGQALDVVVTTGFFDSVETTAEISLHKYRIIYVHTEGGQANSISSMNTLLTSSTFISLNGTYASTVELAFSTVNIYNTKPTNGVLPPENIIFSMPVPGVHAMEYVATQHLVEALSDQAARKWPIVQQDLIYAGWVGGTALMAALTKYMGTTVATRSAFYNNLLAGQFSHVVGELFVGDLGPASCNRPIVWAQGGVCNCHAGGNNVWFHTFVRNDKLVDTAPIRGALFQYGLGMCSNIPVNNKLYTTPNTTDQILRLPRTVHLVGMSLSDDPMTTYMCSQTYSTIARVSNTSLYWHLSRHALRGYCLASSVTAAASDFGTHTDTYVTTSMMGVIPNLMLTKPLANLVLDFIPQTTRPRLAVQNYIYLFPTLDQELYVLMAYLSREKTDAAGVCGVVRTSTVADSSIALLKKTMTTFGFGSTNVQMQPSGFLASSIDASCAFIFVVDADAADVALLAQYLNQNPSTTLLVPFDDVTKQYASFVAAFGPLQATVTKRVVFATNLPSWTGTTMTETDRNKAKALSTVAEYVQTLAPLDQTPAAARAFVVAMLYDKLSRGTSWGQHDLQAALYGNVTVRVGGMKLGPFSRTWMGASSKLINYGASGIVVWPLTRVFDASTPLLSPPATPSLVHQISSVSPSVEWTPVSAANTAKGDCFDMQEASSEVKEITTTTTTTAPPAPTFPEIDPVASASKTTSLSASSSGSNALQAMTIVLGVLLFLVLVYIAVLLLMMCGGVAILLGVIASTPLYPVLVLFQGTDPNAIKQFRQCVEDESKEDVALQQDARSTSRAPGDASGSLSLVFLEVESWRPLWVKEAELMSRATRHFQRCVRQAIMRHNCYEMMSVEGLFVIACATTDAAVKVASDAVRDVAALDPTDSDMISSAYVNCGCGANPKTGLRLIVAVHNGAASRRVDGTGRVLWSGDAVNTVVKAAYTAGNAGLVVFTGRAKSMTTHCPILQPCGRLVQDSASEDLFTATIVGVPSDAADRRKRNRGDPEAALHLLAMTAESRRSLSSAVCKEHLERHYGVLPECQRVADLRCMGQRLCLPVMPLPEEQNEHDTYMTLLNAVSSQLASVTECWYGVPRAGARAAPLFVRASVSAPYCHSSNVQANKASIYFTGKSRKSEGGREGGAPVSPTTPTPAGQRAGLHFLGNSWRAGIQRAEASLLSSPNNAAQGNGSSVSIGGISWRPDGESSMLGSPNTPGQRFGEGMPFLGNSQNPGTETGLQDSQQSPSTRNRASMYFLGNSWKSGFTGEGGNSQDGQSPTVPTGHRTSVYFAGKVRKTLPSRRKSSLFFAYDKEPDKK